MNELNLKDREKEELLRIARKTLISITSGGSSGKSETETEKSYAGGLILKLGMFVTLKCDGRLRGCIGRFSSSQPLYKLVKEMTLNAAVNDSRFEPVRFEEVRGIDIEISVIGKMTKLESIEDIIIGKHGLYISRGGMSGTLLPQVAVEMGWSREEFLGHTSRDKAHLGWSGWKDSDVFVYEALVFGEKQYLG